MKDSNYSTCIQRLVSSNWLCILSFLRPSWPLYSCCTLGVYTGKSLHTRPKHQLKSRSDASKLEPSSILSQRQNLPAKPSTSNNSLADCSDGSLLTDLSDTKRPTTPSNKNTIKLTQNPPTQIQSNAECTLLIESHRSESINNDIDIDGWSSDSSDTNTSETIHAMLVPYLNT